jgi:hypothetical protein
MNLQKWWAREKTKRYLLSAKKKKNKLEKEKKERQKKNKLLATPRFDQGTSGL